MDTLIYFVLSGKDKNGKPTYTRYVQYSIGSESVTISDQKMHYKADSLYDFMRRIVSQSQICTYEFIQFVYNQYQKIRKPYYL